MTRKPKLASEEIVPLERLERQIYLIRGMKVMLDSDLAALYQVPTKVLNQGVKRNRARFPEDFMFQLTAEEVAWIRSQIVTGSKRSSAARPYAFTEHGVAMLSSVLKSARAVQMNIMVVRAFVKLRELVYAHKDLAARVQRLESGQDQHASVINILAEEIDNLKQPPPEPFKKRIGFSA